MRLLTSILLIGTIGCMTPPDKSDPYAALGLTETNKQYQDIRLGIVLSKNSANTHTYLKKTLVKLGRMLNSTASYDPEEIFRTPVSIMKKHFGSVEILKDINAPTASKVDLIVVMDSYYKIGSTPLMKTIADVNLIFMTPGKREIEKIRAKGVRRIPAPTYSYRVKEVTALMSDRLEKALLASSKLAAVSGSMGEPPGAQQRAKPVKKLWVSSIDTPSYSKREDPNRFALIVGIEDYSSVPKADFAERDAEAVRAHAKAMGTPDRNIVLLKGSRAGRASIKKYLETWLPKNLNKNSKLLFFFSGHGAPDTATGQAYLLPWDGDPKFLKDTGYPIKRLYSNLEQLPAKEVLVAMDACFSGAGGRSVLPKGTRPLVTRVDVGRAAVNKLVVLSASDANEITGSEESQGHGLFTYYLLKGLNGAVGSRVTAASLYKYLKPKVRDAARRDNRDQTPQLFAPISRATALRLR